MGHTERYCMRGSINENCTTELTPLCNFRLETNPTHFLFQPLLVTMGDERL